MILIIIGIEQNIYIISASLFLLRCFFTIITILKAFKGSLVKLKKVCEILYVQNKIQPQRQGRFSKRSRAFQKR